MLSAKKTGSVFYNIETLAKKTGLTRRTIHYYVQRGLLPRPEGGGRGHYYTEEHVQRIKAVQRWRSQGVPLEKMKHMLSDEDVALPPRMPEMAAQEVRTGPYREAATVSLSEAASILPEGEASHWIRLPIGRNVEIHFTPGALSQEDLEVIERFVRLRVKP